MKHNFRYFAMALTIAALAGCDHLPSEQLLAPNADVISNGARVANTRTVAAPNRAVAIIGAEGGIVAVDGHRLLVPANAVASPTMFSMQVVEAQAVHVKLRATRIADNSPVTQFPVVPVRLVLDLSNVDALDLTAVRIVYLRDGTYTGAKDVLPSVVDATARTVRARLSHFSDYAAALD